MVKTTNVIIHNLLSNDLKWFIDDTKKKIKKKIMKFKTKIYIVPVKFRFFFLLNINNKIFYEIKKVTFLTF